MTVTSTLTDFLLARIAEDEEAARDAAGWDRAGMARASGRWSRTGLASVEDEDRRSVIYSDAGQVSCEAADHIARHDPARVLADCEARRAIVNYFRVMRENAEQFDALRLSDADAVLAMLAAVYADHPDYRDTWRP